MRGSPKASIHSTGGKLLSLLRPPLRLSNQFQQQDSTTVQYNSLSAQDPTLPACTALDHILLVEPDHVIDT